MRRIEPSLDYQRIADIFLYTENREYLTADDALKLQGLGFNRVVHGHTDHA